MAVMQKEVRGVKALPSETLTADEYMDLSEAESRVLLYNEWGTLGRWTGAWPSDGAVRPRHQSTRPVL